MLKDGIGQDAHKQRVSSTWADSASGVYRVTNVCQRMGAQSLYKTIMQCFQQGGIVSVPMEQNALATQLLKIGG